MDIKILNLHALPRMSYTEQKLIWKARTYLPFILFSYNKYAVYIMSHLKQISRIELYSITKRYFKRFSISFKE